MFGASCCAASRPAQSQTQGLPVIRFENVGLRYGMGPEILRDISFHLPERSFQFLSGPSGAGKTTLLRLLFMSLKPTRGLITVFGKDRARITRQELPLLRRRIGIVFQDFRLRSEERRVGKECRCRWWADD